MINRINLLKIDNESLMEFYNTDFLFDKEIKLVLQKTVSEIPERDWVPAYHFYICNLNGCKMGECNLRVGYTQGLYYAGHIGYQVYEEFRGNKYAAKACKLLFKLAKKHNMDYLYITCNPDNIPSRKTCEYLKGEYLGTYELPEDNDMRVELGETSKSIFRFIL